MLLTGLRRLLVQAPKTSTAAEIREMAHTAAHFRAAERLRGGGWKAIASSGVHRLLFIPHPQWPCE